MDTLWLKPNKQVWIILILTIFMLGCSQGPLYDEIQGCWENEKGDVKYIFEKNNFQTYGNGGNASGTYKIKNIQNFNKSYVDTLILTFKEISYNEKYNPNKNNFEKINIATPGDKMGVSVDVIESKNKLLFQNENIMTPCK